jgi:hypothetical protein
LAKRTRYQYGSVEINKRVTGPDVWLYRWWEPTSDGRRTRRGFTVGTVEQYKTEAHALTNSLPPQLLEILQAVRSAAGNLPGSIRHGHEAAQ